MSSRASGLSGHTLLRVLAVIAALGLALGNRGAGAYPPSRLPTADSRPPAAQTACWAPVEAAAHTGERGCVEGTVTNAVFAQRSNGQPTFLDFGPDFTAVIWGDDRPKFSPPPETLRGQRLRVSGPVSTFRGKAQIVVRDPGQLGPAGAAPSQATRVPRAAVTATPPPMAQEQAGGAATAMPAATAPTSAVVVSTAVPPIPVASSDTLAASSRPASRALTPAPPVSVGAASAPADTGGPSRWLLLAGLGLIGAGAAGGVWLRLHRGG